VEEIKNMLPGFDYERLSDEQKEAVDEAFRILSEKYSTLDLTPLRIKFKLEEKKYYDMETESEFYRRATENKIVVENQGWKKEGLGDDAIHYPLVTLSGDIRDFDQILATCKKELVEIMNIPQV